MEEMKEKLKQEILEVLNLEDIRPEDIDNEAPLLSFPFCSSPATPI